MAILTAKIPEEMAGMRLDQCLAEIFIPVVNYKPGSRLDESQLINAHLKSKIKSMAVNR
jgi:hypothetical protein